MEVILEFKQVGFGYTHGGKRINILQSADMQFEKSVFYAITGPSGSGKTTTLALAGALDVPESGQILFDGEDIKKIGFTRHRRHNVAMIFQNYNLINYMTALENIILAMDLAGSYPRERKKQALKILIELGLTEDEAVRNVMKLSGGQQQRVAIARALASDAEVILADEPTGNLDVDTAREIIGVFKQLAHLYHKCVIVVSHSLEVAAEADAAYQLKGGSLNTFKLPGVIAR